MVANADDPMVAWAARGAANLTWVASGQRWHDDSWVCPECGSPIERVPGDWFCTGCDLRRPDPQWTVDGDTVIGPAGERYPVTLQLPGRVNRANAATALAVAAQFGVRPAEAAPRLAQVASIAGRYATVERDGRTIRLLLAKNPAGWLEAFDMAEAAPTLLSINARDPDGFDTSWLYDVDFSPLRGRQVLITGDRAMDLAVRLEVNEVPFTHVPSFRRALTTVAARPARGDRQLHRVPGHQSGVGPCQLSPATGPRPTPSRASRRCASSGSTPTCCRPTATAATC